jgi:FimV-like protein
LYKRFLMFIVCGLLACGSVSAQESGVLSDARPAANLQLKGVLISNSNRTALINGQLFQKGDFVGGAEILAIDQSEIRVLMGAREYTVDVGGTFVGSRSSGDVIRVSHSPATQNRNREQAVVARSAPLQNREIARLDADLRHTVKFGETLFGIARRYKSNDVTVNQMMIALFQANVQAFDNNINVIYEGAVLRIPDGSELHQHAPAMATTEVMRHTDRWQAANHRRTEAENALSNKQYGPVGSGETLSGIAARVLHDGATLNQMMSALFQANPQAFSNDINVLHQGAVLRIPDENELRRQTAESIARAVRARPLPAYISIASASSTLPPACRCGQAFALAIASSTSFASIRL